MITRQTSLVMAAILVAFMAASSSAIAADQPPRLRLSEVQNIQPVSYRAELTLDPMKDDFSGSISIRMDVKKPAQTIWLEQEKITIRGASLTAGGKTMTAKTLPGGEDFVGFQFDSPVPAGLAEFKIEYSGIVVTKNSIAIFRQQDNGNWYIFSQFEPTDARGAFPCFDEPSYKTPWQLTLHVPAADNAISNTNPGSDKIEGGTRTVVFHETPPLPSYLVAFGVGPFEYVPAGFTAMKHAPVRIVVPKGHMAEAKYAAEVTAAIINHHEKYFGIPFPYEKADQVAVPDTSGWGAMENPGMVTYAQTILLAQPQNDTIGRKRNYFTAAAHELAHQWFGDLVTTAWWNDIWLNEAFATWFEQKTTREMHPEWKTEIEDVDAKLYAMRQDSLITARKIRQPIETKDDINNAFDGITYQKGAAVIRMFESWMTPARFQRGVEDYMRRYSWRAATADDFLASLSSIWKKDISKPFSTFLNQSGIPTVSVSMMCGNGATTLHLEQERFLPLGSKGSADQIWSIPFCVREPGGVNECSLMTGKTTDLLLKANSCPAWLDANANAIGYYRVDYQGDLLSKLTSGDVEHRLTAPERVDLMSNAAALANAGRLSAGDTLGLVATFHGDSERNVVLSAADLALAPRAHQVPKDLQANYKRFLLKNFLPRAHELGWIPKAGEPEDDRLLRSSLVRLVATEGGDGELALEGRKLAEKWLQDHSSLDPDMVNPVLDTAAYYGDKGTFDRFFAEFQKTTDRQTRQNLLGALGSFRDPEAIKEGMNMVVQGRVPFIQGASLLFAGQQEDATRKIAFEFLQSNWDEITSMMPSGGGFDFGSVLPNVGASFCDAQSRDEFSAFFKPRVDKFVGAPRALDQAIEAINLCIAKVAAQKADVDAFLRKY